MYKYSKYLLPEEFYDYFKPRTEVRNHFTRSSDGLSVQFACTNYRKISIHYSRGPPVWNAIPCKIRGMQTFSRFKCLWKVHMTYDGLDTYMHIFINSILFHPLHRFLYPLNIRLDSVKHLCCASISVISYFILFLFLLFF